MGASERGEFPKDLMRARSRFGAWRAWRKAGSRIPPGLWSLAVRLAQRHGISRTATALGVDYYSLKKQTEATAREAPSRGPACSQSRRPARLSPLASPAFVELPAPLVVARQCLFELDKGTGAARRVQLVGYDAADVEMLARRFWNAE